MKKPIILIMAATALTFSSCRRHFTCNCQNKNSYAYYAGNYATFGYDAPSKKKAQATCDTYAADTAIYSSCALE